MLHTIVATPLRRPKLSLSERIAHAPVIPEGDGTFAISFPFITRHFHVVAEHRASIFRKEDIRTRVRAQIKATIGFIVSIPRP